MRKLLVPLLLFGATCGDEDQPPILPECHPLSPVWDECMLPFPSQFFLVEDSSTATGYRVSIPDGVLPVNLNDEPIDTAWYNARDGFSASAPILITFGRAVDDASLPPPGQEQESLEPSSGTVLVDMTTYERVAHFAEVDVNADSPERQALIIRPAARLEPNRWYAVGVRKHVKATDGRDLPHPSGWVKGGFNESEPVAALVQSGVPADDLVVGWGFVTASDEMVNRDLYAARDAVVEAAAGAAMTFSIDSDEPAGNPDETWRQLKGTFQAPMLLTSQDGDGLLLRDASGTPIASETETYDAPFVLTLPKCAETMTGPIPVVIYGHGLMGSLAETGGGYPRHFAQRTCMAVIGTEWRGMSSIDLPTVAMTLNDLSRAPLVMEKLVQGINNFVALELLVRMPTPLGLEREDGSVILDASRVHYYGISQGGIFGGTYLAISPSVERGVLGVPASNYSLLLERSSNWPTYKVIVEGAYGDALEQQKILLLLQMHFDAVDPISTNPYLLDAGKQVLLQMAVGDSQVANLATYVEARTIGIDILGPSPVAPYGLNVLPGPLASALTIWDEGVEAPPLDNSERPDNGTHGSLRWRDAVNDQIETFFDTGEIVMTCLSGGEPVGCTCTVADEICGPPH